MKSIVHVVAVACVVGILSSAGGRGRAQGGPALDGRAHATAPASTAERLVRHRRLGRRIVRAGSASVSEDAVGLATLAPPARASTTAQTYGDAAYARRRMEVVIAARERSGRGSPPSTYPVPCDRRTASASAYVCEGVLHLHRYEEGYALSPSYLSAPQRLGVPADTQDPILPPETGLAWIVNSLRYDPHN